MKLKEYIFSPAEITKIMFENFDSFENCIFQLNNTLYTI